MADPVETVRERAQSNAFWRFLGVRVEDAKEGWCRLRVPLRDELRNAPARRPTAAFAVRSSTWRWAAP
jgi:acyl-coenzyme A thioesterase PaaI-like protein